MEKVNKTPTFEELYQRDIKKYVEKLKKTYKDKRTGQERFFELSYLSWAYGHREMKRIDPNASEKVVEFPLVWQGHKIDGVYVPYLQTSQGFFVKCEVTINGRTESEWLPVLDNSNRPIDNPTTFQINTSHKRCFVKALAKHGLGLYLYVGEDLPENITQTESDTQVIDNNQQQTQAQPNNQQWDSQRTDAIEGKRRFLNDTFNEFFKNYMTSQIYASNLAQMIGVEDVLQADLSALVGSSKQLRKQIQDQESNKQQAQQAPQNNFKWGQ